MTHLREKLVHLDKQAQSERHNPSSMSSDAKLSLSQMDHIYQMCLEYEEVREYLQTLARVSRLGEEVLDQLTVRNFYDIDNLIRHAQNRQIDEERQTVISDIKSVIKWDQ